MSKFNKTKEWLIEEYVIKDRPRGLVASECGLTEAGLKSLLAKFNIKKEKLVIDINKLKELIDNGLHVDEIAANFGCSETSVYRALYKNGLKILAAPRLKEQYNNSLDSQIIDLYQNKKMSSTQIGKLLGVTHTYVLTHLEHCGVLRRTLSESLFAYNKKDYPVELLDFDAIYDLYVNMKKSKKDLGIMFNCDSGVINRVLTNFNIHIRNNSEAHIGLYTGEKHHNWKGGITPLNSRLREFFYVQQVPKVLKRDGYKCQLCGKKGKLHVHHIKYFSDIVQRIVAEHPEYTPKDNINELYKIAIKDKELNDLSNLITYCPECHRYKIHGYKRNILKADVKSIELLESPIQDNQQPSLLILEGSTTISKESTPKQEEAVEPLNEV